MKYEELLTWLSESEDHFLHENGRVYSREDVRFSGIIRMYDRIIKVAGNYYIAIYERGVWKPDYARQIYVGGVV